MLSEPVPVICIPHAGAGASFFAPWLKHDLPGIVLLPAHPPGREDRIEEPPCRDLPALVQDLLANVLGAQRELPRRVAVFGHSFGAVLAFEMARLIQDMPGITVERVFASGSPGPREKRPKRTTGLSDEEFLDRVEELAGYRHPAFRIPALREMLLPDLIADVRMHEDYEPSSPEPLDVPISSFRGADDALVSPEAAATWRSATSREFEPVDFPGGHMYLADDPAQILAAIAGRLTAETPGTPGTGPRDTQPHFTKAVQL